MLTPAELAAELKISVRQVQRLDAAGMPSTPTGKRGKVYDLDRCRQWLEESYGPCLSNAPKKAGGKSVSASAVAAFTDACRRAQVRVKRSNSKPISGQRSDAAPPLSLVTRR